jgi:hypothetical protein
MPVTDRNGMLKDRPLKGHTMAMLVKKRLAPYPAGAGNSDYTPLDGKESQRNEAIAKNMRLMSHVVNMVRMRVVLPNDGHSETSIHKAQANRSAEWTHQAVMPYYSSFMITPTDAQRLNNPAQAAAMNQRQLAIPNSYGQFYAFMHALSAAFGNLQ